MSKTPTQAPVANAGRANDRPVYLDYQATTPTDPRVLAAMLPWFTEKFANPHSTHGPGREVHEAVERARRQVAALIGADPHEIVFTSGATEANNLAIKGAARFQRAMRGDGEKDRIVTPATEHKCVLESCKALTEEGFSVDILPVQEDGLVDLEVLAATLGPRTLLVSVMAVNNEVGTIQKLAEIGALCRARGILFHSDAAQAAGKIPLDVEAMKLDLVSLSGHKLYAPKGIGALYVRRRPRVRLAPLIVGGGQERGLRSGTLPAPLCIALGEACAIAQDEMAAEAVRLATLRRRFLDAVRSRLPETRLNGDAERRVAGNLNLQFPGVDAEILLETCPSVAASTGSACAAASIEPAYVLQALGLDETAARGSVRLGFGRFTTAAEVDFAADALVSAVRRLQDGATARQVTNALGGAT